MSRNLQNAVCSYYDLEMPVSTLPSMRVLEDITMGNGEAVAPNTTFVKAWRIKNSGNNQGQCLALHIYRPATHTDFISI